MAGIYEYFYSGKVHVPPFVCIDFVGTGCSAGYFPGCPPDLEPKERKAVLLVVEEFFDTMASKDVEGARRILIPEGRFHSVRDQEAGKVVQTFTNEEYLMDLAEGKERFRERMWNPEVHIRGFIATVWTSYDFWIDGKLSHCGFDSFNLIKSDGKWKIADGVYTVERKCKPSPLGPLKKK